MRRNFATVKCVSDVNRRQLPVQKRLQKPRRCQRVQPLLLLLARDLLPAPLALDQILLGGEAAESLINENNGLAGAGREIPPPSRRLLCRRADRIVHVQRQADDDSMDVLFWNDG